MKPRPGWRDHGKIRLPVILAIRKAPQLIQKPKGFSMLTLSCNGSEIDRKRGSAPVKKRRGYLNTTPNCSTGNRKHTSVMSHHSIPKVSE